MLGIKMNGVVHFEIPFDDKDKCKEFYEKVFGWQMQEMPEMNYVMARTGETDDKQMPKDVGVINGGMYKRDESSAKSPVLVINVPSADEHVKKVEEAGGKIFREKVKVGEMGYYVQVSDTEGNVIGLWEPIQKN
jgi:uncharacterized protein